MLYTLCYVWKLGNTWKRLKYEYRAAHQRKEPLTREVSCFVSGKVRTPIIPYVVTELVVQFKKH